MQIKGGEIVNTGIKKLWEAFKSLIVFLPWPALAHTWLKEKEKEESRTLWSEGETLEQVPRKPEVGVDKPSGLSHVKANETWESTAHVHLRVQPKCVLVKFIWESSADALHQNPIKNTGEGMIILSVGRKGS